MLFYHHIIGDEHQYIVHWLGGGNFLISCLYLMRAVIEIGKSCFPPFPPYNGLTPPLVNRCARH